MYRNYQNFNRKNENTIEQLAELDALLRDLMISAVCLKLEIAEDAYADEDEPPVLVMTLDPTGDLNICTQDEGDELFEDADSLDDFIVFNDRLILTCEASKVVELDGTSYLLGSAVIREIDDYGNDCSVNENTIRNAYDFVEANLTSIAVDGKEIPAFRLVD